MSEKILMLRVGIARDAGTAELAVVVLIDETAIQFTPDEARELAAGLMQAAKDLEEQNNARAN